MARKHSTSQTHAFRFTLFATQNSQGKEALFLLITVSHNGLANVTSKCLSKSLKSDQLSAAAVGLQV